MRDLHWIPILENVARTGSLWVCHSFSSEMDSSCLQAWWLELSPWDTGGTGNKGTGSVLQTCARHKSTHRHCVSKCFYTHLQLCWMELCPRFEMSKINMVYSVTRNNFKCQQLVCFFVSILHVWQEKHLSHPACCWAWFVGGSSLGEGRSVPVLSRRGFLLDDPWEDLRGFPGVCTPWDNCCSMFSFHFFLKYLIMWMCVSV